MKRFMIYFIVSVLMVGCDSQSPNAIMVDNMTITLLRTEITSDVEMDVLSWGYGSEEISGGGFGYMVTLADPTGEITPAGVLIDFELVFHKSPLYYPSSEGDIFNETALGGEKYGYLFSPDSPYDYNPDGGDEGLGSIRTITNPLGEAGVIVGLGRRDNWYTGDYDPAFRWPFMGDFVDTAFELKIMMPRKSGDLVSYSWGRFVKAQFQEMFNPSGGIFGNSFSGLGHWGTEMAAVLVSPAPAGTFLSRNFPAKDPNNIKPQPALILPLKEMSYSFTANTNENIELFDFGWWQLVFNKEYWAFVPTEISSIYPGYMEVDTMNKIASYIMISEPYYHRFMIMVKRSAYAVSPVNTLVGELKSVDENGKVLMVKFININVIGVYPNTLFRDELWTQYQCQSANILPVVNEDGEMTIIAPWGGVYTSIYCPVGAHLEISNNETYGDFLFDGKVNFLDYHWIAKKQGLTWQQLGYDPLYDADLDGDIDMEDLGAFAESWLNERYPAGDLNTDHIVNFLDFAIEPTDVNIIEHWLEGK